MQNPRAKGLSRFISAALVLAMVLAALPPFELPVFAAEEETSSSGAVYLDADDSGKTIYIKQGVFSVTVNGAQDIELIFGERTADGATGVTMNRRSVEGDLDDANGDTIENLYYVSQQLNNLQNGSTGKAQTCPLMITGNATVRATFHGKCRFYAGTNACIVSNQNVYTAQTQYGTNNYNRTNGNGFAGIQVNSGSTLIIEGADDLKVFGGHQFAIPGEDGKVTINDTTINYGDMLRANHDIGNHEDPYNNSASKAPEHATDKNYSGGAGIGGGPTLRTSSTGTSSFTTGSPGTIIINGGNVEAFGGYQAAGIGGAVNSPATTGMIQINGGNVIAHGGRWAAGLGDGDTVNGGAPNTFINASTLIEINGGTVEAYGGVASPGIGAADEVSHGNGFTTSAIRQLQINLNGGTIRAYSGFPSGYSGAADINKAPAAIGVGVDTNAPANSLYVSSEADLRCAGFGHYALSENGVNPNTVPTIAVDSDGYLLLLQFDDYYSSEERVVKVYEPQKILKQVDLDNDNHLEAEVEVTIFTGHTKRDNQDVIEKFYIYTTEDAEGNIQQHVFNEGGTHATEVDHLTLYVDENSKEIQDLR
ncbi:MAG: hypothetical protein J6V15_03535, partial [Clostridia bacterium]|nr:hypothetical protein [Clostridia bacterium]